MTILQMILIAAFHSYMYNPIPQTVCAKVYPYTYSWVIGAICGDWRQGLIIGATIQTLNMTPIVIGSIHTIDLWFATCVSIPLVIYSGLSIESATTIAAAVGVFAQMLGYFEKTLQTIFLTPWLQKKAEAADWRGYIVTQNFGQILINFPLRFIVMFVTLYLGQNAVDVLVANAPGWLMTGFATAAGLLPAIGFGMFLALMGKMKYLPYFFIGFYFCKYLGLNVLTIGILGICLALIRTSSSEEEGIKLATTTAGGNDDDDDF